MTEGGGKSNMAKKMKAPFFEFGPKTYIWGDRAVEMAKTMDKLSAKYDVDAIFTAQYTDLERIRRHTERIFVFAQHMDVVHPGIGIGAVLPEALAECGVSGVMLNHEERQLTIAGLHQTVRRADEVGLITLVCSGNCEEAKMAACLSPNIVLVENPDLIGKKTRTEEELKLIIEINNQIHSINKDVLIMHAAGIRSPEDVYNVILAGADGTGSTSAIAKADNPEYMLEAMMCKAREAWDERIRKEKIYGLQ